MKFKVGRCNHMPKMAKIKINDVIIVILTPKNLERLSKKILKYLEKNRHE